VVDLVAHIAAGFGLSYALGFERQLRGAVAGNRTFAMVGTASAAVTAVAHVSSPQAIAGVITGIGFIGAGVVFRGASGFVHGVTTAATLFTAAALGIVVGYGYLFVGLLMTIALLIVLEVPHIPVLRLIDARTYLRWVSQDPDIASARADLLASDSPAPPSEPKRTGSSPEGEARA